MSELGFNDSDNYHVQLSDRYVVFALPNSCCSFGADRGAILAADLKSALCRDQHQADLLEFRNYAVRLLD